MGLRSATAPYTRSDRQLYDTFAGGDFPSFDTGYAKIVELMQAHLTIPSFSARSQAAARKSHSLMTGQAACIKRPSRTPMGSWPATIASQPPASP